jgi:hypothetical protein
MSVNHCRHIKEDGFFCQAPALHGREYCRFHLRALGRRIRMARALAQREPFRLVLPILEDMNAVHVALMLVLDALAAGLVEHKRAGLLLYGLQQASANLRSLTAKPSLGVYDEQTDTGPRAEEYPGFEEEFGLPADLDLSQPPEVLFPPAAAAAITQAEPSPFRSNPWQNVNPEDMELEEILFIHGEAACKKRGDELERKQWKKIEGERRKLAEAHRMVAAARRNGHEFTNAGQKAFYEKERAEAEARAKADAEEVAAMRAAAVASLAERKAVESAAGGATGAAGRAGL